MHSRTTTTSRRCTPTSTSTPRSSSALWRSAAGGHRPLERLQTDVALAQPLLLGHAAVQAEQPLGEQQVDDDRQVHDQRDDLERADGFRELVDLERQERRRRDEGEVLGPALLEPEADRLGAFEQRVGADARGRQSQLRRLEREELVERVQDAVVLARPLAAAE